jgi:hypothetical protein
LFSQLKTRGNQEERTTTKTSPPSEGGVAAAASADGVVLSSATNSRLGETQRTTPPKRHPSFGRSGVFLVVFLSRGREESIRFCIFDCGAARRGRSMQFSQTSSIQNQRRSTRFNSSRQISFTDRQQQPSLLRILKLPNNKPIMLRQPRRPQFLPPHKRR